MPSSSITDEPTTTSSTSHLESFFARPPPPTTPLGIHRQLSPTAGLHVSPLCLGGMSLGDQWAKFGMGSMNKEDSFKMLDKFWECGGNFVDTANNYQNETSEMFIGEWMEMKGNRDQMVIATKYTSSWKRGASIEEIPQRTHYVGNSTKSLHLSVEASLKKLRTTYIDILYLHWWDYTTSVEEVMNGLHHLVAQGKVLYLGVSDTPAWIVSKANQYARMTGKTPFTIYQGAWSILERDFERDILSMAKSEGMALAPWNVLGAGKIRSTAEENRRRETGENGRTSFNPNWERTPTEIKVCDALETIAAKLNAKSIGAVAIAYVMQKTPHVFPIIGGRKVEHLEMNLEALSVRLEEEDVKFLESVLPFDVGFPVNKFGNGSEYRPAYKTAGYFEKWPVAEAIKPSGTTVTVASLG